MPLHASLTGADLHENKGVAAASDNTVATASSGTTVWQKITASSIDTATVKNLNRLTLSAQLTDMSTSTAVYVPVPASGTLVSVAVTTQATTTGSDASISILNGVTTLGTFSVPAGTAGETTNAVITGAFSSGDSLTVSSAGGSTGTCPLQITLLIALT